MSNKNMTVWLDSKVIDFYSRLAKKAKRSRNQTVAMILNGVAAQKHQSLDKALAEIDCEELICQK